MRKLWNILVKVLPLQCTVGVSVIGGSIVEIQADAETTNRVTLLGWTFRPDWNIFSDSQKKVTDDLVEALRTLKNLEMVRHRLNVCPKCTQSQDGEERYNLKNLRWKKRSTSFRR